MNYFTQWTFVLIAINKRTPKLLSWYNILFNLICEKSFSMNFAFIFAIFLLAFFFMKNSWKLCWISEKCYLLLIYNFSKSTGNKIGEFGTVSLTLKYTITILYNYENTSSFKFVVLYLTGKYLKNNYKRAVFLSIEFVMILIVFVFIRFFTQPSCCYK